MNHRRTAPGSFTAAPILLCAALGAFWAAQILPWIAAQVAAQPGHPISQITTVLPTLMRTGLAGLIGPSGSRVLFWFVLSGMIVIVAVPAVWVGQRAWRRVHRDGRAAMRDPDQWSDMRGKALIRRAQSMQPSLQATPVRDITPRQAGVRLGKLGGQPVYASLEDVKLVIMGPRSNKTSAIAVPDILTARGPVVATSNKPDIWVLTHALRSRIGPVYTFDAQNIAYVRQTWWWNPLRQVTDVDSADRMAGYFMKEAGLGSGRSDPFFTPAAHRTLRQLILAAAVSGKTLRDVASWAALRSYAPADLLDQHGYTAQAEALRATLELAPETRGGVFEGVSTAIRCLDSERVLRWVTPPETWSQRPKETVSELWLWDLLASPDGHATLYLLTREGAGTARPIVAAMVGELFEVAGDAARAQGGRLDPALTVCLDECANIVRIDNLPAMFSFFGSQSLLVTAILQSREQGREVWGRSGFDALWSAATIKIIGAGVQDDEFAESISRLIGEHKIPEVSTSHGPGGRSTSTQLHRERIMELADVAALPKTNAILIVPGRRPGLLTLEPWYNEREFEDISTYAEQATAEITAAAIEYLGESNPVAQMLRARNNGTPATPTELTPPEVRPAPPIEEVQQ